MGLKERWKTLPRNLGGRLALTGATWRTCKPRVGHPVRGFGVSRNVAFLRRPGFTGILITPDGYPAATRLQFARAGSGTSTNQGLAMAATSDHASVLAIPHSGNILMIRGA